MGKGDRVRLRIEGIEQDEKDSKNGMEREKHRKAGKEQSENNNLCHCVVGTC